MTWISRVLLSGPMERRSATQITQVMSPTMPGAYKTVWSAHLRAGEMPNAILIERLYVGVITTNRKKKTNFTGSTLALIVGAYPTSPFPILEPQHPWIDEFYVV